MNMMLWILFISKSFVLLLSELSSNTQTCSHFNLLIRASENSASFSDSHSHSCSFFYILSRQLMVSIQASALSCPWDSDRLRPQLQPLRLPPVYSYCVVSHIWISCVHCYTQHTSSPQTSHNSPIYTFHPAVCTRMADSNCGIFLCLGEGEVQV